MIKYYMFILAALISGAAVGYYFGEDSRPQSVESSAEPEVAPAEAIPDAGSDALVESLKARIAELESQLAERRRPRRPRGENEVAEGEEQPSGEDRRARRGRGGDFEERREAFRREHPEAYAQMTNQVAVWRQRRGELHRNKIDILNSINISHLGPEAVATHEGLKALIAERGQLEADLTNPELSRDERIELFRRLGDVDREMRRVNGEERNILIAETARELGLDGEQADAFVGAINDVITATDNDAFAGGRPPRGPGGRGGPGGFPPMR